MKEIHDIFSNIFPEFKCSSFELRELNESDFKSLESVLMDNASRKYYFLPKEYRRQKKLYFSHLLENYINKKGITWVISNSNQNAVIGFITVEFVNAFHELCGVINIAIKNEYRNMKIATEAMKLVCDFFNCYYISYLRADVREDLKSYLNESFFISKVLKRNGFISDGSNSHYKNSDGYAVKYDELRVTYCKQVIDSREFLCRQAEKYSLNKDYINSINAYNNAFRKDYKEGSLYTKAYLYKLVGLQYFSTGHYDVSYEYLSKASSLGLNDNSIIEKLNWIKNNIIKQ